MKQEELVASVSSPLWRDDIIQELQKLANIILQDSSLTDEDRIFVMKNRCKEIEERRQRNENTPMHKVQVLPQEQGKAENIRPRTRI